MTNSRSISTARRFLIIVSGLSISYATHSAQLTELDCIIEPEITIELSSPVNGIVQSIQVDKSDQVKKGQILARLEASVEKTVVDFARLRSQMNEDVQAKTIQRDMALRKKQRMIELYEKNSVSRFDVDEAEAEATLSELELIRAKNGKKLAVLELKKAVADLNLRSITSPVDGVVVERYVQAGESVKDRPVLKLAKIDPMRVEIIAPSYLFGLVKPGVSIEVIVEEPAKAVHLAQVSVVDSVVDAASDTFGIRLSLPNPDQRVVGGVKCTASFDIQKSGQPI